MFTLFSALGGIEMVIFSLSKQSREAWSVLCQGCVCGRGREPRRESIADRFLRDNQAGHRGPYTPPVNFRVNVT